MPSEETDSSSVAPPMQPLFVPGQVPEVGGESRPATSKQECALQKPDGNEGPDQGCGRLREVVVQHCMVSAWEKSVERFHGKPQVDSSGVPRFGEHWGISRAQCLKLLRDLQDDPHWDPRTNMYTFVNERVKPATKGTGMGLALWMNRDNPLEVNKMVSHCWAENVEEFLNQVIQSTVEGDVLFICAFCIYQCEDGAGPTIAEQIGTVPAETPFGRVLSSVRRLDARASLLARSHKQLQWMPSWLIVLAALLFFAYPIYSGRLPKWDGRCHGFLISQRHSFSHHFVNLNGQTDVVPPSFDGCNGKNTVCVKYVAEVCPSYAWPLQIAAVLCALCAAAAQALKLALPNAGGMIIVPTRATDIYTRLWCVYEIFFGAMQMQVNVELARTLIACGTCASATARCSSSADLRRIKAEIEANGGFCEVDRAVRKVSRDSHLRIAMDFSRYAALGFVGIPGALSLNGFSQTAAYGGVLAWASFCVPSVLIVMKIIIPSQGALNVKQAWIAVLGPLLSVVCTCIVVHLLCHYLFMPWFGLKQFDFPIFSAGFVIVQFMLVAFLEIGVFFVYLPLTLAQSWSYWKGSRIVPTAFSTTFTFWMTVVVVPQLGQDGGKFGQLLPWYDTAVVVMAFLTCTLIFFVFLPQLLLEFNVHVLRAGSRERDATPAINPTPGERLVYLWQRRMFEWTPFAAQPEGLDCSTVPQELAARGLDNATWSQWMESLRSVKKLAWRSPRMWLWTAFHLAMFFSWFVISWLTLLLFLPFLFLPGYVLNTYQSELEKWLEGFNGILFPMGMLVKTQTIKRVGTEVSYLSFALTPSETELLRKEPVIAPGHCLSWQHPGGPEENGRCLKHRGRVI